MKKILIILSVLFCTTVFAHTIEWYVGDTLLSTTTCESGDNITPPTIPEKFGYHFSEWAEYNPIEYLESTGTQIIDTGYASNSIYGIEAHFQTINNSVWGSIFSGTLDDCTIGYSNTYQNVLYLRYAGEEISRDIPITAGTFNYLSIKNNTITINGNFYKSFSQGKCGTTSSNFYIFNNSGKSRPTRIKLKNLKLYDYIGSLVRDFIPVLDSNGIPCMYDMIEGKFYYNAGTGQFIAGPVIVE